MSRSGHIRLFNIIAPVYSLFFRRQVNNYRRIINNNAQIFNDRKYEILDIGCGTGALVYVLAHMGHQVEGVDASKSMIERARRFNQDNAASFRSGDVLDLYDPAEDLSRYEKQYDLVVASYVMHGLPREQRLAIYSAVKLLARKRVIIMDYNQKTNIFTSIIEWLEGGDYFNFIKNIEQEMENSFSSVRVISTGKRSAWYICECEHRS